MSTIITLTGKAGSGKDSTVKLLKEALESQGKSVLMLAYGDYIKCIASRNYGYDDTNKEEDRHLLLEVGDLGRSKNESIWYQILSVVITSFGDTFDYYLITDARSIPELRCDKSLTSRFPFYNILVKRLFESKLKEENKNHKTEQLASNPDMYKYDYYILNNRTLDDLKDTCSNLALELVEKESLSKEICG